MKTVYHLSFSSPFGGAGIASRLICKVCSTGAYNSVFLDRSSNSICPPFLIKILLFLRKKVLDLLSLVIFNQVTTISFGLLSVFGLSRRDLHNASIVHLHWINGLVFPLWRIKFVHQPIVWQLHDTWPFAGVTHTLLPQHDLRKTFLPFLVNKLFNSYVRFCLFRKLSTNTLHICVSSSHMRKIVLSNSLLNKSSVSVIPLPLPDYPAASTSSSYHAPPDYPHSPSVLIVTGERPHDPNKNISAGIIAALHYCNSSLDASVLVAGRPHSDFSDNDNHLKNLGFLPRKDLFLLYKNVSVVVVPSIFESFSQVSLEALISGTPVVCLRGSGVESHPYDNLIFASETDAPDHLAYCIRTAIKAKLHFDDSEISRRIITHNQHIAQSYSSLYDTLLGS